MSAVPDVTVVVTHYDAQPLLDLVLMALELQTVAADRFEVVVSDDGSPTAPVLGARPYPVRLVRQADDGFRAAAARNLGARAGTGAVICFLDGDTVPEPGYLEAVVAAVTGGGADLPEDDRAAGPAGGGATGRLVVGRRRHADLTGWTPARVRAWLLAAPGAEAPVELEEPAWLVEAYERTRDLTDADDGGYRFVISAVLAMPRSLFDAVGGFDPTFSSYGGEDWELANRCWLAGADLLHARAAVAWHDGPDFAGRDLDRLAAKNGEALAVAERITDPASRGQGLLWAQPDVVVRVHGAGWSAAALLLALGSLLRDTDAGVWLVGRAGSADAALPAPLDADPRVHRGDPPAAVLARARYVADVTSPVVLQGVRLRELCAEAPLVAGPGLEVRRTRDLARGAAEARFTERPDVVPVHAADLGRTWGQAAKQR